MDTTQARAEGMERAADRFDDVNASLQRMLTRLLSDLEALRGQWQGAGGRSFTQATTTWAEDQRALQRALTQTAEALRTAGRGYRATDEEAADLFSRTTRNRIELPL